MAGREVREYTNLSDPKDKKLGKGKDRIDDEDITFQRMVAKTVRRIFLITCPDRDLGLSPRVVDAKQMQEVAGERGGYLHGRGALDSDDLLYLKEQMEAEEDAERLLRRTEKRAFAAFKKAASLADSTPAPVPLALRVEPKPKSGIRQQDLLKRVLEVKPKRQKASDPVNGNPSTPTSSNRDSEHVKPEVEQEKNGHSSRSSAGEIPRENEGSAKKDASEDKSAKSLLGLAYASSDDEED